ncbi:MAG: response regulator [Nitrospirae bacterium]|nr:response regulator [Nitrospirota bacterium]
MHTVLIVDDDPDDIELATIALEAAEPDINVRSALGGSAALALLRDGGGRPDLILLDMKMLGMNGFETLREIRADLHLRDIPVVIVTSSDLESDRKAADSAGANSFLHKAVNMEQFSRDIKSLLERYPG